MNLERTLTSNEVAEMIGKEHSRLLKDIRIYIKYLNEGKIDPVDFFIKSTYKDAKNQERPNYLLTKQGCEMVSNKLTGAKGVQFTAKYVSRFNQMETHIKEAQPKLPTDPMEILKLTFEAQEQTNERVDVIEDKVTELSESMRVSGQQEFEIKQTANVAVIKVLGGKDSKAYEKLSRKVFSNFWSEFKKYFKVPRYGELPRKRFDEALRYISFWAPDTELRILIATENAQTKLFDVIA
ncbi:Rha family transcriptional regulator [Vagococcus fluvialis]|uniref:Rha family transcriptional regulator n=1 Tax=Vagococcus fluvialis TaxID=2738 RepID=UPI001D0BCF09|nr:Rha family transcriptional regulator [Vagococcus fluvialis]UDM79563.1 ORF6C domain-containing protein [Vagococcus fluvialis]